MIVDDILESLTTIALRLEKEVNDNTLSDNLINVRNRARASASLSTVQNVLGDDWLVDAFATELMIISTRRRKVS